MADQNTTSIANREDAIPIISITNTDEGDHAPSPLKDQRASSSSRIDQIKSSSSRAASKVREKLEGLEGKKVESPSSMQDRLLNMWVISPTVLRSVRSSCVSAPHKECIRSCVIRSPATSVYIRLLSHISRSDSGSFLNKTDYCGVSISALLLRSVLHMNSRTSSRDC